MSESLCLGWQLLIGVGVVGALLWSVVRWYLLDLRGVNVKGKVLERKRQKFNADTPYVVYYEFSVPNAYGAMSFYIGRYTGEYVFQNNDVIVIRYWAGYTRLNRVIERVV